MADGTSSKSKRLANFPKISAKTIENKLKLCKKSDAGEKGYKMFSESFIHNVYTTDQGNQIYLATGLCHRSQRKSELPHRVRISVTSKEGIGEVIDSSCSCKAGDGGHCQHVCALLYMFNHWGLLGLSEIPADLTCTSLPQAWHKPRGESIKPDPVMKCTFVKSSSDKEKCRKLNPVSCKLYDARSSKKNWNQETIMTMCENLKSEENPPPFSYLLSDQEASESVNTVFGNVPLGSVLGYQLSDLNERKITFYTSRPDECILPSQQHLQEIIPFPQLPLIQGTQSFILPDGYSQSSIFKAVSITQEQALEIEKHTVGQADNTRWFQEKRYRLTASNFGRVLFRQQQPSESFLNSIFVPKDLSNVASICHGKKNEAIVRAIYTRKMQVKVHKKFMMYDCGLLVNPSIPFIGATPDGKAYDPTCRSPFGLIEIKCPFSFRSMTLDEACNDPNFYCTMVDGVSKLKHDHKCGYYAQVQGQLALSGLNWCDFIIYLSSSHIITVERILFNNEYWNNTLLPKLKSFYYNHGVPFLEYKYFTDD